MAIPRVLIDITGGVVQWINADGPVDIVVVDDAADVDMDCKNDREKVREVNDDKWYFWDLPVDIVSPEVIDPFFKAADEIEDTIRSKASSIKTA